jgi:hypothetical protein
MKRRSEKVDEFFPEKMWVKQREEETGLRPGSLDRNPNMKRETKNITTVYTKSLRVSITQSPS